MTTAISTSAGGLGTHKGLNIALWAAQIVLAAMFGMAGVMKTFTPIAELSQSLPWTAEVPVLLVRFIGVSELLGSLGLILPAATRVAPRLTGFAAVGLALVMLLAAGFHLMRGEAGALPINLALFGLAAFVAWGRLRKLPIAAR
jgi:uncharacterized membrane protein YphA (DoxX/SURF4 family)